MEPRNADLERMILEDPDDEAAFRVYGDWLAARGEPRGQLIAMCTGAEQVSPALIDAFVAEHPELWDTIRPFGNVVRNARWRLGFIDAIEISDRKAGPGWRNSGAPDHVLDKLLDGPGRFVRALTFELSFERTAPAVVATIARRTIPTLESLELHDGSRDRPVLDLARLWTALPRLRRLRSCGNVALGALPESLRELVISHELSERVAREIASADLPALERLELAARVPWETFRDALRPLLAGDRVPALRHLALTHLPDRAGVAEALAASPLVRRLERLDLSHGALLERDAGLLAAAGLTERTVLDGNPIGDAIAEADAARGDIADAIRRLPSPFFHAGTWSPAEPIAIVIPGHPPFGVGDLTRLAELAPPAVFGDATGTRLDPAVREGRQLDGAGVEVRGLELEPILERVRAELFPDCGIAAELLSVNLYATGGHFARHKDTPRGDMLGTLVVGLPTSFTGGALVLHQGPRRDELDLATTRWVAYYTGVDHEVAPVETGWRATLTYRIVRRSDPVARGLGDAPSELHARFAAFDESVLIPCLFAYPTTADTPLRLPIHLADVSLLRGRDATVALAALAAGRTVTLVRCLALSGTGAVWPLHNPLTAERIAELDVELEPSSFEDFADVHRVDAVGPLGDGELVFQRSYSYIGNAYSETDFYAIAALEITAW